MADCLEAEPPRVAPNAASARSPYAMTADGVGESPGDDPRPAWKSRGAATVGARSGDLAYRELAGGVYGWPVAAIRDGLAAVVAAMRGPAVRMALIAAGHRSRSRLAALPLGR